MAHFVDEYYVREILHDMPAGLNHQQFRERCQPDLNAGYGQEVDEAERRYFRRASASERTRH
jgi:hypothetical protein